MDVESGWCSDLNVYETLNNMYYEIHTEERNNASYIVHPNIKTLLRQIKDKDGHDIFLEEQEIDRPGSSGCNFGIGYKLVDTLLGRVVHYCDHLDNENLVGLISEKEEVWVDLEDPIANTAREMLVDGSREEAEKLANNLEPDQDKLDEIAENLNEITEDLEDENGHDIQSFAKIYEEEDEDSFIKGDDLNFEVDGELLGHAFYEEVKERYQDGHWMDNMFESDDDSAIEIEYVEHSGETETFPLDDAAFNDKHPDIVESENKIEEGEEGLKFSVTGAGDIRYGTFEPRFQKTIGFYDNKDPHEFLGYLNVSYSLDFLNENALHGGNVEFGIEDNIEKIMDVVGNFNDDIVYARTEVFGPLVDEEEKKNHFESDGLSKPIESRQILRAELKELTLKDNGDILTFYFPRINRWQEEHNSTHREYIDEYLHGAVLEADPENFMPFDIRVEDEDDYTNRNTIDIIEESGDNGSSWC